jgi:hypothetical protein
MEIAFISSNKIHLEMKEEARQFSSKILTKSYRKTIKVYSCHAYWEQYCVSSLWVFHGVLLMNR